jgi:hypothetical protein
MEDVQPFVQDPQLSKPIDEPYTQLRLRVVTVALKAWAFFCCAAFIRWP